MPDPINRDKLRAAMKRAGVTGKEIAIRLKCGRTHYSAMLKGTNKSITWEKALEIADVLGVDVWDLTDAPARYGLEGADQAFWDLYCQQPEAVKADIRGAVRLLLGDFSGESAELDRPLGRFGRTIEDMLADEARQKDA